MKRFSVFLNEASKQVVYRGVSGKYDPKYKNDITWVSTSKEHAEMYAGTTGEVVSFTLDIPKNILVLGFRPAETEVKFKEVADRVIKNITELFRIGAIKRDIAIQIIDNIREIERVGYKQVWEWVHDSALLRLINIAGFSLIEQNEGLIRGSGKIKTYGVLNNRLLTQKENKNV